VSLLAAVAFALYQIYYLATDQIVVHWSQLWLLDGGFSFMLYTVILFSIAFLWRPSKSSRRYAYAQVGQGDDGATGEDEFGLEGAVGTAVAADDDDDVDVELQAIEEAVADAEEPNHFAVGNHVADASTGTGQDADETAKLA